MDAWNSDSVKSSGSESAFIRIIKMLCDAEDIDSFCCRIQLFVRLDPDSDRSLYGELEGNPLVTISRGFFFYSESMINRNEIIDTASLLRHTDVVISVLSTFILESSYFDKPNISLRFEEFLQLYERDFLDPLYETGGVTFANDFPALVEALNRHLSTPQENAAARLSILRDLCAGGDGRVLERVMNEIDRLLAG